MAYYNIGEHFNWFMGRVVELDPTEDPKFKRYLGRVKIRVIHDQTGDLGKIKSPYGIPDSDLLWAWPLSSIQSASLSYRKIVELEEYPTPFWIDAVGTSPTGIAVGTYVFGFYIDGAEHNIPVIFATYHKDSLYPEPPTDDAAGDMLQIKPPDGPMYDYMDVSALAKGWHDDPDRDENHPLGKEYPPATEPEKGGQMLPKHKSSANPDGYKKGLMNLVWEPSSDYNTKYPFNFVHTTKSGHAIELDDTPGHERMHMWHRSGTYEEISNAPSNPGIDADRGKVKNVYPETGPSGWNYTTAGGVAEPDWKGRRSRKTMDSFFETVIKDKNELLQRDHNVSIANTQTVKIGNTYHWTVGYQDPPPNRINDNGSTKYDGGAIDQYNLYLDVANNVTLTAGNNRVVQVGYEIEKERRLEKDVDTWNYFRDVYNTSILVSENNHLLSVGYNKDTERKIDRANFPVTKNYYRDVGNNTIQTTENNMAVSVGYSKDEERGLSDTDESTYYRDVRNNTHIRTNNNYNLNVGLTKDQERKLSPLDYGNYYNNVAGNLYHHVGGDEIFEVQGNHTTQAYIISNKAKVGNFLESEGGLWLKSGTGITVDSDMTVINDKTLNARLSAKNGASGSWTTPDGKKVTVTAGIVTDIV